MSEPGAFDAAPITAPIPDDGHKVGEIGVNKPMLIRIQSIFTGQQASGDALITSAVRSALDNEAAPWAMHGVHQDVEPEKFLRFRATAPGSPVMYYTKACLDTSLNLETRLSFDRFDQDKYNRYVDLLASAAKLPVFAATGGMFGPAGAFGSGAAIVAASKAVKVVLNMIDDALDDNEKADFISTYTLDLDTPGISRAKAGWFLMRDDDQDESVLISASGSMGDDTQFVNDDVAFKVDSQGNLVYKESGRLVDDLDQPYVLIHISGTENDELDGFVPAAATAVLLDKFITKGNDTIENLTDMVSAYNDLVMTRRAIKLGEDSKKATGEEKDKLVAQREAVVKHIQDEELQKMIPEIS